MEDGDSIHRRWLQHCPLFNATSSKGKLPFAAAAVSQKGQNVLSKYSKLWVTLGDDLFCLTSSIVSQLPLTHINILCLHYPVVCVLSHKYQTLALKKKQHNTDKQVHPFQVKPDLNPNIICRQLSEPHLSGVLGSGRVSTLQQEPLLRFFSLQLSSCIQCHPTKKLSKRMILVSMVSCCFLLFGVHEISKTFQLKQV